MQTVEHWQMAGEIFGRLIEGVDRGEVTMQGYRFVDVDRMEGVKFRWRRYEHGGPEIGTIIPFEEMALDRLDAEGYAERTLAKWRSLAEEGAPTEDSPCQAPG